MAEPRVFNEAVDLSKKQLESFNFVKSRVDDLKLARSEQENKIENIWSDADRDYVPHKLKGKAKKTLVTDEEKGWRGALVNLGESNWQSDISQPNPYIKIQVALSILIDQNPEGVFSAGSKKFQATTELMRQLYKRSWETAKSKQQLKLFVFNLAKYGWACARTYPLRISRKVQELIEFNQDEPDKSVYKEKEVVEFNDIFRENLDPWNVWIDDMAQPDNSFSVRDWCWRKVYPLDTFKEEFAGWKLTDLVTEGGVTTDRLVSKTNTEKRKFKEKKLVEVYFYENRIKDLFVVIAGGVPAVISPLPISNLKGVKKLSLWQTYWNLRSATSLFGIGIYEAMRYDQNLLDKIRNMTIDQLVLSIYKMFFFQGTQSLTETGDIKITPGFGKQVLDPKNINWLQVPGPGNEAWLGIDKFRKDLDEASGITDPLLGSITGKTAFEIAQAKEAALKRLKNPLDNITDALNTDAYITVALVQLLYSIPEVYEIADPLLIEDYLQEIKSDPELFEREVRTDQETGQETDVFKAKVFPEFPLNLDKDEEGNLIETNNTKFFRIKPKSLGWEGIINIKSQSVLGESQQIKKALELEMYNMLIPLIAPRPSPTPDGSITDIGPQVYGKIAKMLVKLYDKDPRDLLPDNWVNEQQAQPFQQPEQQSLFVPAGQEPVGAGQFPQVPAPQAETLVNRTQIPERPQGLGQRIMSRLTQPFR